MQSRSTRDNGDRIVDMQPDDKRSLGAKYFSWHMVAIIALLEFGLLGFLALHALEAWIAKN
jgi:hypothetical protein